MPVKIGHQPPFDYFGVLGVHRWEQTLPTKPGLYFYTESECKGSDGPVWLCKVYAYRKKLWVRFYTGPYRIRMKGSRRPGASQTVIYEKTALDGMRHTNGNVKLWLPVKGPPDPPSSYEIRGRAVVGGLPSRPGRISHPRVKTVIIRRMYG